MVGRGRRGSKPGEAAGQERAGDAGFLDYAGPSNPLAMAWLLYCLPPTRNEVGILIYGLVPFVSENTTPTLHRTHLSRLRCVNALLRKSTPPKGIVAFPLNLNVLCPWELPNEESSGMGA